MTNNGFKTLRAMTNLEKSLEIWNLIKQMAYLVQMLIFKLKTMFSKIN